MLIIELYRLKKENNFEEFYKNISTFIPDLKEYVTTKLEIAENHGLIDKGFYDANGILDEVYMEVFKTFSKDIDEKQLRKILFNNILEKINEKTKTEQQFTDNINIDDILKEELDLLNEEFTVDAGGDFILDEELDDISYKQKSFRPTHFILDHSLEQQLAEKFKLNDIELLTIEKRKLLGELFYTIPPKIKTIIELHVIANQSISEISDILLVDQEKVKEVIIVVSERLKLLS